jgi:hypothetical protein
MKTRFALCACLCLGAALTASAAQVTFQVNMSAQTALGAFDPANDSVFVAGDPINAWSETASPLTRSATDQALWVGTFDVPGDPDLTVQYKFLMTTANGTTWEGSVGPGGPTGNRTFNLAAADQTLPAVYFNNVTSGTTVSGDVTFQVNMAVQIELGNFDPASGTVTLAGEFNGWSATAFELTRSGTDPNIWAGTLKLSGAAESSVSYKFVMNGATWEGNVGPNGAQNRSVALKNENQVLPVVYFSNVNAQPVVIPLTFEVNLATQIALGTFDPEAGTVSVAGDPLNGWSATASTLARSATETNVWTGTFDVTGTAGATLLFKFVLNEATWEGIDNRSYTLASTNAQTLPRVFFNNADNLGRLNLGAIAAGKTTLTWTAGPLIRLQTTANLGSGGWTDVPGSLGQESATVTVSGERAFFRLVGP